MSMIAHEWSKNELMIIRGHFVAIMFYCSLYMNSILPLVLTKILSIHFVLQRTFSNFAV